MPRTWMLPVVALGLTIAVSALSADRSHRVRLLETRRGDVNELWVEVVGSEGSPRHLLRQTAEELIPDATGTDPTGRAAFVSWTESESGHWTAYSRDGGSSWSRPVQLDLDLRLRAGNVGPNDTTPAVEADLTLPPQGRLFVVQFRTFSLPEWRQALEELGADVVGYFPHHAHIVRMPPSLISSLSSLEFVQRILPYHPAYRLESALKAWHKGAKDARETSNGKLRIIAVTFEWGPTSKERVIESAEASGASVAEYWPSGHVVDLWVDREQLAQLAAHDDVMWIDRWNPPEPDMDRVREDSGANWLETNHGNCGQGVRGEVLDLGIQESHQDFDGILLHGSHSIDPHGTSTYGIVFGNGDRDGDGDADATGLLPCGQGIFADTGGFSDRFAHAQELKQAPYFASFQTNSWGNGLTKSYNSYSHEMDDIIWRLDIAITQSQSNTGTQDSRPQAWAKNIISVGGITHFNDLTSSNDVWDGGYSIGPAEDGRLKPDLNYWGDNIYTTDAEPGGYSPGVYTDAFGGTSGATAEVAGVLGLIVEMWSDNVWNTDPQGATVFDRQPHFSTIKALMINNAQQYDFSGTNHDLTRVHQGWGRPSVRLAKQRAADSFVIDERDRLQVGEVASYIAQVGAGQSELKITMVYPDPPGTISSSLHRVNDLNLKVISPSGVLYHGNVGLDAGTHSSDGGSPNGVDTVENVFVASPEAGIWTIEVEAAEVNQDAVLTTSADDVAFALVVTGASGECGNGIKEAAEECDGTDVGGETCADRGCTGGTLTCTPSCTLDLSTCTGCPVCDDDSVCETDEDCNSCPNDCFGSSGPSCGDGLCDGGGEDCFTCQEDCRCTGQNCSQGCCGDGICFKENVNNCPVDCGGNVDPPVPSCCGDDICEGSEDADNCQIDCGCGNDDDCDDGDACTTGSCDPGGGCVSTFLPCGDGDGCCGPACDAGNDPDCSSTTCGNGACEGGGEDCFTCPDDCRCAGGQSCNACCGDGICAGPGENANNCPVDCS